MAQSAKLQTRSTQPTGLTGGKPLFGPKPVATPKPGRNIEDRLERIVTSPKPSLVDQLNERLQEKYREYERAAIRLELRGEHDAAKVLRQAAGRARLLRNTHVEEGGL